MSETTQAGREGRRQGRGIVLRRYHAPTLAKGPTLAAITANPAVSGFSDT
jgi:hypothetical protein